MTRKSAILGRLEPLADPVRAAAMTAYHKTPRPVLGVGNLEINGAVAGWRAERPVEDWLVEADLLWRSGVFEARVAAGKLLTRARFPDRGEETAVWEMICGWVPEFDGWAIADAAASAGERRVMADLSRLDALAGWPRDPAMWTRRAALTFTLPLAKLPHPGTREQDARARVLGWAAALVPQPDWFIQKAIAWWLRTLSKHDPDAVTAFLAAHGAGMKAFARKDAARLLPHAGGNTARPGQGA